MSNARPTPGLRTCGSCAYWQQSFCEAPIPAWVERYFSIEIGTVDLADDDQMAEHCEMYQERQEVRRLRAENAAQRVVYLRCTGFLDSLPEAPNCCESCLEDDGTGDAPFEEYRPPALPGRWPLDSWVVFEVCCTHLWWLKSLDEQEQRRVVAKWLHWHRRQRGGER